MGWFWADPVAPARQVAPHPMPRDSGRAPPVSIYAVYVFGIAL